jgi:hypothetical protein
LLRKFPNDAESTAAHRHQMNDHQSLFASARSASPCRIQQAAMATILIAIAAIPSVIVHPSLDTQNSHL